MAAKRKKTLAPLEVTPDPVNRGTVILNRWPTEEEKTTEFVARVRAARRGHMPEPAP